MAHDRHQNWLFLGTKNTDLQAWFHMLSPIGRKEITQIHANLIKTENKLISALVQMPNGLSIHIRKLRHH